MVFFALSLKTIIVLLVRKYSIVEYSFDFVYKHTLAMYLTETIGGLLNPPRKDVSIWCDKVLSGIICNMCVSRTIHEGCNSN